jgi:hypothetical protein
MISLAELPALHVSFADAPVLYAVVLMCLATGTAASVRLHWLLRRSRQDRIDLRPGDSVFSGRSWIWQQNVLDPRNYRSEAGNSMVRRIGICIVLQVVAFPAALIAAFFALL